MLSFATNKPIYSASDVTTCAELAIYIYIQYTFIIYITLLLKKIVYQ